MPLGQDREDNLLGPGQARGSPQGPYDRELQPPQVGVRHRGDGHSMERQRGDQRADGALLGFIGGELGEAVKGAPSRFQALGQHRPRDSRAPNGDVDVELAESCRQRDRDSPEQDRRGALSPLDLGAGFVHADVLACDLQPLLPRGDRPLEGGRAQGHRLGVIRIARGPQRSVAGACILEGEWGPRLQVHRRVLVQNGGEGGRPPAHLPAQGVHLPFPDRGEYIHQDHRHRAAPEDAVGGSPILKAWRSCLYMAPRARHVPGSMPGSNSGANTTA